jgi:hypothetical protein
VAQLGRRWRDAGAVREALLAAPPLLLALLEVLIECGGFVSDDTLAEMMYERSGVGADTVSSLSRSAELSGLAARVTYGSGSGRKTETAMGVFDELVPALAPLVYGVTLPVGPVPPSHAAAPPPPEGLGAALAVAGLASHVGMRCTLDEGLHRGDARKLARSLGMATDPDELEALVDQATRAGALVSGADRRFEADPERMCAIAEGACLEPVDEMLRGWVREPRLFELVARALARLSWDGILARPGAWQVPRYLGSRELSRTTLERSAGVSRVDLDGVEWLVAASRGAALPDEVDGFVTPSLEVMVGPQPDPRIVARLALGAQLVRIDRVLTFRLRPETVRRGVASGVDGPALVDVLERIGRHPLPQSVRVQVLDWARGARHARAAPMTVLRVPPHLIDDASSALRGLGVEVLGPGVLGLPQPIALETLRTALAEVEVELFGRACESPLGRRGAHLDLADAREPPLPLVALADPELARRLAEDRARAYEASFDQLRAQLPKPASVDPWGVLRARRADVTPGVKRAVDAMISAHERVGAELAAWIASRPDAERPRFEAALNDPMVLFPILMVAPDPRRRLLEADLTLEEIVQELVGIVKQGKLSPEGRKIQQGFDKPAFARLVEEAFLGATDDDEEWDEEAEVLPPPQQTRASLLALLRGCAGREEPLWLWWSSNEEDRRGLFWIDQLHTRGGETVLLVTDTKTDESCVLALDAVTAASHL